MFFLQIKFHYVTRKLDESKTILDDNRKCSQPMELLTGKKFKLEVWEKCLKTMRHGEVASFTVETRVSGLVLLVNTLW